MWATISSYDHGELIVWNSHSKRSVCPLPQSQTALLAQHGHHHYDSLNKSPRPRSHPSGLEQERRLWQRARPRCWWELRLYHPYYCGWEQSQLRHLFGSVGYERRHVSSEKKRLDGLAARHVGWPALHQGRLGDEGESSLDAHVHESRDYPQSHRAYRAKRIEFLPFLQIFGRALVRRGSPSAFCWVWVNTCSSVFPLSPCPHAVIFSNGNYVQG